MSARRARAGEGRMPADSLVARLDDAVASGDAATIAARVKEVLERAVRDGEIALPDAFRRTRPDAYARRLLHRAPDGRYTVVVMTWAPGQRTSLHDHAGIWCVECVVEGRMEVAQYELVGREGERFRFEQRSRVSAGVGAAGCLIPPFEYHTLGNALADRPSITLHVYGGEMDHCHVFEPDGDAYLRREKRLGYDD
jgi:predicted metal-dependent enzyme (double-stranded beta helix superfamily)